MMIDEELATKEGSLVHKEGKANKTQVKEMRTGQTIKTVGEKQRGNVKQTTK